jgi:UPF0716 protein FxsA
MSRALPLLHGPRLRSPTSGAMFARLGCLFVLAPLVELALLVQVGRWIGVLPTVGLVAVTGLVGAGLARREGLRALVRVQGELLQGRLPTRAILDGASVVVGGLLLLTPGVLSDLLGFALILPPTRWVIQGWVAGRVLKGVKQGAIRFAVLDPMGQNPAAPPKGGSAPSDDPDRPPRPGEILR